MQTSRFQLGLIATLAVGLGFSLSSSDAVGYPAGAAVSMGANPVWSVGGQLGADASISLDSIGAAGADSIVTDAVFSIDRFNGDCYGTLAIEATVDGESVGEFSLHVPGFSNQGRHTYGHGFFKGGGGPTIAPISFRSGLRVPSDGTLTLNTVRYGGCSDILLRYTLSGYYAQP